MESVCGPASQPDNIGEVKGLLGRSKSLVDDWPDSWLFQVLEERVFGRKNPYSFECLVIKEIAGLSLL